MRFHVDTDLGSEILLWIAPDHPDEVPRIGIWNGQNYLATMEANVLRDDVRQLGMHSTGQVGFSINSDTVKDIESMDELMVVVQKDATDKSQGLVIYRRAGGRLLNRGQRLLIIETAPGGVKPIWNTSLSHYALSYSNLDDFNLETLMSVLGNELAPSIGAVGFPYLSRIRSILSSLNYQVAFMFRDPLISLARQIDLRIAIHESIPSNGQRTNSSIMGRRTLITILRDISETEAFELSNPVTRRLLKAPGEQVSQKDLTNALRQLTQFELVATDKTRDLLVGREEGNPVMLPPAPVITERQGQIAEHLRHIGIATDMIAEDLTLYDLTSDAITRACGKIPARSNRDITE